MPDYTNPNGPTASPTADPNGVAFTTSSTSGGEGQPGYQLVTVGLNQRLTLGTSGEPLIFTQFQTVWVPVFQVRDLRRDGIIF